MFLWQAIIEAEGVILYSEGKTKVIIKTGDAPPGDKGKLTTISAVDINDNSTIVFIGTTLPEGQTMPQQAIYRVEDGEIVAVVKSGDVVREPRIVVVTPYSASLNNNNEIAFDAQLSNGLQGLFLLTDDGIQSLVISGDQFSVLDQEGKLVFADLPVINDKSEIVFRARILKRGGRPGHLEDMSSGVFLYSDGDIVPVKLPEGNATGTNDMVFWNEHISWMTLSNNSDVVFRGDFKVPGGDDNKFSDRRGSGMFLWSEGDTKNIVLPFDELSGTGGLVFRYEGSLSKNSINDHGDIVVPILTTKNELGLFMIIDNEITPILLAQNDRFDRENQILFRDSAGINNRKDIAFIGDDIAGRGVFLATIEE